MIRIADGGTAYPELKAPGGNNEFIRRKENYKIFRGGC